MCSACIPDWTGKSINWPVSIIHNIIFCWSGCLASQPLSVTPGWSSLIYLVFPVWQLCRNRIALLSYLLSTFDCNSTPSAHCIRDAQSHCTRSVSSTCYVYSIHTLVLQSEHQAGGGRALRISSIGGSAEPACWHQQLRTDSQGWEHRNAFHSASPHSCCRVLT